MRLVLHIGMEKTGTTSLQRTLRDERNYLKEAGILYPTSKHPPFDHQWLMCLLLEPDDLPREFRTIRSLDHDAVRGFGARFWDELQNQVTESRPQTVVLSYESFFLLKREPLERLRDLLASSFSDIEVIAYIRHPSTLWLSKAQQAVKGSEIITPPGLYRSNLRAHLTRHIDVFDGRVIARAFDPETLHHGNVVRDFLSSYIPGGDDLAQSMTIASENESMSGEAMCVLQAFYRQFWPNQAGVFAIEGRELLAVLQMLRRDLHQQSPKLRPGVEAKIAENHEQDLKWLHERFGIAFPSWRGSISHSGAADPRALLSADLRDILQVDPAAIDRTILHALRQLAARSASPRSKAPNRRARTGPASAIGSEVVDASELQPIRVRPATPASSSPSRLRRLVRHLQPRRSRWP